MIFWQTARTAQRARPGQRVPTRRASQLERLTILVDTRERYPYKFAGRPVQRQRSALPVGDYAVRHGDQLIAAVERKTLEDFTKPLIDGSLNYALAELAALPAAAVVVEERYGALLDNQHTQPGWLLELVARHHVRYPAVPIVFADSRKLAEEWTYRFLAAALVHHAPEHAQQPDDDPPPP
jgi:ERCC4-type nuclease